MSQMSETAKQRMKKLSKLYSTYTHPEINRMFQVQDYEAGYQAGMQDPDANADIIAEHYRVIVNQLKHIRDQLKHIKKLETKNEHVTELINWVLDFEESDFKEYPSETHPYYRALYVGLGPKAANKALKEAKGDE